MYSNSITTPYFNYSNSNLNNPSKDPNSINNNIDGLVYLIKKEKYYSTILNATELAGKFKQENKRYYFIFRDLSNNTTHKLTADDIILAKKQINNWDKYKDDVKYKLYNDGYNNKNMRCETQCYNEQYNNQDKIVNLGYNSVKDKDLNDFLTKNSSSTFIHKKYFSETDLNNKSAVYKQFYKEYNEACFYVSKIRAKINQIKNNSLSGKTSNILVQLNNTIFPNLPSGELNRMYTSQNIVIIYNSVIKYLGLI